MGDFKPIAASTSAHNTLMMTNPTSQITPEKTLLHTFSSAKLYISNEECSYTVEMTALFCPMVKPN